MYNVARKSTCFNQYGRRDLVLSHLYTLILRHTHEHAHTPTNTCITHTFNYGKSVFAKKYISKV